MIDLVLLFLAQWIVVVVATRQLQAVGLSSTEPCAVGSVAMCEGPSSTVWVFVLLFLLASTIGYHALFEGLWGTTPGKRWVGLQVVSDQGTSPIGIGAGILRSIVRQLFWLVLFFMFDVSPLSVGPPSGLFLVLVLATVALMATGAFNPNGQAIHDLVAKTRVVRSDRFMPAAPVPRPKPDADLEPQPTKVADQEEAV